VGRSLDLVEQARDVIHIKPFAEAKVDGPDAERFDRRVGACVEPSPDGVIHDASERTATTAHFALESGRDIVI